MVVVEIRSVADCPNVTAAEDLVRRCSARLGLDVDIVHRIGDFPSPTVLVDGLDVMAAPASSVSACRLDLPTQDRVMAALHRAIEMSNNP
ncbi:alkylmercury lyase [Nocardia halotolerans]|uniref:Alkylmercury lyase n=1 Tax=Nocardia halotolerans TaxID=1755878 RepID=A0ABV8VPP5_9NOCA